MSVPNQESTKGLDEGFVSFLENKEENQPIYRYVLS
jgi:hypothetical protein